MFLGEHYLLAKAEGTPYSEEAPADVNAIEAYDINITPLAGPTMNKNDIADGMHGAKEEIQLETWVNISFKVYFSNSGSAGTPPAYGLLLAASFLSETIVGTTSVTYAPAVTNAPVTIYYDIGNGASTTRHKIIGCGGSVNLVEQNNQKGYFEFSLVGFYTRPLEATEITPDLSSFIDEGKTFDNDNVDTFTIGGFAGDIISYSINLGPATAPHNLVGRKQIDFAGREITGSLSLIAEELDTKNFFTVAESHNSVTTGALSIIKGSTGGAIETISAPKVQLTNIRQGNHDGLLSYDMDMRFIPNTGDDELALIFT